ncbi:MAG TPA: metalloregulator ArsR/SmtB family transcription factor [Candidatus Thermoplasmatota archaeon]|nr:metalloregulator ArsR/SmtB family transcription factor [Candidatus Thermoplasmatota archaeon]
MGEIEIFKALGDATRLKILECVRSGEKCICEIIPKTGKSQPTVSQHLKILKIAGLINERKDGAKIMIRVAHKEIYDVIEKVKKIQSD